MVEQKSQTVYLVAGPNGAGKTSFASQLLPKFVQCREFLNADLIAAGLSPFAPETQGFRAGRILLERIRELIDQGQSFGFETTLSGRSYANLLVAMRAQGYRVELFFLWLPNPEMAIDRVENRVRQGGHHVPAEDIRRRYPKGIRNFFQLYIPLVNCWRLYDASRLPPKLIATEDSGVRIIRRKRIFQQIRDQAEVNDA
jgi:predicted ABC-type ATPase